MTGTASASPSLVATVGLHGSASTWVFNIARELVAATVGEEELVTFYADQLGHLPEAAIEARKHVVFKSHHGSGELDAWLQGRGALIVLSFRDPRDACLSISQRFAAPLQHSAHWVATDCLRVCRLAGEGYPVFRFEDRFFEDRTAIDRLAEHLGLACPPGLGERLFAQYATEAVRGFAGRLDQLPAERLTMVGAYPMDRVTQVLAPHIGDGRSGKWRELPPEVQSELTRWFRPFLEQFGYDA